MKKSFAVLALLFTLLIAASGSARTITLTAADCDEMAMLNAQAPKLSWGDPQNPGVFNSESNLHWYNPVTLLMRFPITERIPAGQRITRADLTIFPRYIGGVPVITVRRVLSEWGLGVCQQYRMTYPKKLEWAQPGARGAGVDRTIKDSASYKMEKIEEYTADVSEDVELWYTGGAKNHGWIFTNESTGYAAFDSPYSPRHSGDRFWKLQVTFEPK